MDGDTLIKLPGTIFAWSSVITIAAGVVVFFLYQLRRSDITLLRESIKDLVGRVEFLENENVRLKSEIQKKTSDYDNLKFKKNYLKQLIMESLSKKTDLSQTLIAEMLDGKKQ